MKAADIIIITNIIISNYGYVYLSSDAYSSLTTYIGVIQ